MPMLRTGNGGFPSGGGGYDPGYDTSGSSTFQPYQSPPAFSGGAGGFAGPKVDTSQQYYPPMANADANPSGDPGNTIPYYQQLLNSGFVPPRVQRALTPSYRPMDASPSMDPYAIQPLGGFRIPSAQTLNGLNPTDLQALSGTLSAMGNRPEDIIGQANRLGYGPDTQLARYGPRVRVLY